MADKIVVENGELQVPDNPVIPFIEGDGTGPDIWAAASRVLDAAVEKAYDGKKKIAWKEVFAGEKAFNKTGEWLPQETLDTIDEYKIAIKGPLTTPIGGGFRSLNVAFVKSLICIIVYVLFVIMKEYLHLLNIQKMSIWLFSVKTQKISMQELSGNKEHLKLKK